MYSILGEALARHTNEPDGDHSSFRRMTRLLLRAIDFGASAVSMALCARPFCVHFYKDMERGLQMRRRSPSPLLIPPGLNRN